MTRETSSITGIYAHGTPRLGSVEINSYNVELKDEEGFLGDRANKASFRDILERWRKLLRQDPFGKEPSENIKKKALDAVLVGEDTEASAIVHSAIEEYAQELAYVIRHFLKAKAWERTERIVVGGGFRDSRLGELAIARAEIILRNKKFNVELQAICHHPDDAGLLGALHLAPSRLFKSYDSILAVDIGGSNIRCGVVETRSKKSSDLSKARVWKSKTWRYVEDAPGRDGTVKWLVKALDDLIDKASKKKFRLAPFIGIACPGTIESDGSIDKGAQNLPGNWESSKFNLPLCLIKAIPQIGEHDTAIVMHNDGVVQGLSEIPFMQDVKRWGVLTIGTGLGNARFTNRDDETDN
ncbi:ROK family protein [Bradyrhizobium sp. ORS 111]|uniref:ROK family protein n=1 Tax=Bradyrhizobium sp. ORS 111 TaxID=1685958 RepID=UPI00388DEAE8